MIHTCGVARLSHLAEPVGPNGPDPHMGRGFSEDAPDEDFLKGNPRMSELTSGPDENAALMVHGSRPGGPVIK